jgi:hypothetical protein
MDFVGLAAAIAFIAVGPSAAAVTEESVDQFRQGAFSQEASLGSSSFTADAGDGSFRLAQSTQGDDDGDCEEYSGGDDCVEDGDSGSGLGDGSESDPFQFDYLPSDQNILETWYDFQNEVYVDNIPNYWGPPHANALRTRMYGTGGVGVRCLVGGGAIMFSVKARRLGCWRGAKSPPARGLKIPALGPAAQRVLAGCKFSTGSVTLRNGAFACIATPRAVVRRAAKGGPARRSPVRSSLG